MFPHGWCVLWDWKLMTVHIAADLLIALSYFAIPLFIVRIRRQVENVIGRRILLLFIAFIVACGMTHVFDVLTLFYSWYWLQGYVKVITAALSIAAALFLGHMLWLLVKDDEA